MNLIDNELNQDHFAIIIFDKDQKMNLIDPTFDQDFIKGASKI